MSRKRIDDFDAILLIGGIIGIVISGLLRPYNQSTGIIALLLILLGFSVASFGTGLICIIRGILK
jgi:hypothetical protein